MTTKHKKGPWRIGAVESGRVAIDSADGQEVTGFIDPEDAPLILSAPDLLEALQRIADGQEMSGVFTFADVVLRYQEIARAAIAKATGDQP